MASEQVDPGSLGHGPEPGARSFEPAVQFEERIADLVLRDVRRMPLPAGFVPARARRHEAASISGLRGLPVVGAHAPLPVDSQTVVPKVENELPCRQCPLCERAGLGRPLGIPWIFGGQASSLELLVILDYPFEVEERAHDLQEESNPNHLVTRLLRKAGLLVGATITYALRAPVSVLPETAFVRVCAQTWLTAELESQKPKKVVCFGPYAREAYETSVAHAGDSGQTEALFFPSTLELVHHPLWRKGVWEKFRSLTPAGS